MSELWIGKTGGKPSGLGGFVVAALAASAIVCASASAGDIWLHMLTTGTPAATKVVGDTLGGGGNWYVNMEVGQVSWNASDLGVGTNTSSDASWDWAAAGWYEDGAYPNKHVRRDFGAFRFTAAGNWYFAGRAKGDAVDAWHYANNDVWGNSGTFSPSYYFTVLALTNVTNYSATNNPSHATNQIDVTWTRDPNPHYTMVVRKLHTGQSWTEPTPGVGYSQGSAVGQGTNVYFGQGTTVNDSALQPDTAYDYKFYTENNSYYSTGVTTNNIITLASEPTSAPSSMSFSAVTTTAMTVGWTRGGGSNVIVVCQDGGPPSDPVDATGYSANAAYGSGTALGSGFVVYIGTGTSVPVTGLTAGHTYYFSAYEFNGVNATNYLVSSKLASNKVTLANEPAGNPSVGTFTAVTGTGMTINWSGGAGTSNLVVMKAGGAVDSDPVDGATYTANASFSSGTQLGTGNYVVFKGTNTTTSVAVNNLAAGQTYSVKVYAFNGVSGSENYLTVSPGAGSTNTPLTAPTSVSSNLSITALSPSGMTVGFAPGNGAYHMVVMRAAGAVNWTPTDNADYGAGVNANFGTALDQGSGNKIVYSGAGSSVAVSGLGSATAYYVTVYEFNSSGALFAYYTSGAPVSNATTWASEPTSQPSGLGFAGVGSNGLSVTWSGSGNGASQMVIMKAGSAVDAFPADATGYTANSTFGSGGSQIGAGNYIVYSGSGSPAAVSGLTPNTTYHVAVIGFNGAGATANYYTNSPATGSQATLDTVPVIAWGPTSITVTAMVGATLSPQSLYVTNSGGSRLCYTVSSSATSWLNVSPATATNTANAGTTHTVTFTTTGLSACTSNGTLTIQSVGTGTNQPVQPSQTVSVSMTLTNIPAPTGCSATASGKELVNLGWTSSGSVLIVNQVGADPTTAPTQGASYSVGQSIGGGTVIFTGSGSAFAHMVAAGSDNRYAFYAMSGSTYYSAAANASVALGSYGSNPTEVVEPFNYTNGATLAGLVGGGGLAAGWSESSTGSYTVASSSISPVAAGYPAAGGHKVLVHPSANTTVTALRTLATAVTTGKLYVAFMVNYQWSGPNKWCGLHLMDGATPTAFFGEIGSVDQQLGIGFTGFSDTGSSYGLNAGGNYIVVGRYDFSTQTLSTKAYWSGATVDATEPGSWDATRAGSGIAQVTGVRLGAAGTDISATPGDTYFDEVRVARSWSGLLNLLATRPSASPSSLTFSSVATTSMTVGWTGGNGTSNLVIVRDGAAVTSDPYEGTSYTASSSFGSGSALGGGYVVFKGTNTTTTVDVTGLTAGHTYHVSVYAFNGAGGTENYLVASPGSSNITTAVPTPPAIAVDAATPTFSAYQGSFPAAQSFHVTNTGGSTLNYTNTLSYGAGASGWLSVSPANQSVAAGAGWTNTLSVVASNLAPGTYYATNTLTGNQTNGTPILAVSLTVQAPLNPGSLAVVTNTTAPATRLDLAWSKNAQGHDVMVVRSADAAFFTPANGSTYSAGYTTGNDVVVYKGSGTAVTDTGLLPGTRYYYRFFSENFTFYSAGADTTGVTATVTARNTSGGAPEQPANLYVGDTNQTFGLDSWGMIEGNWGKARVVIHTNSDVASGAYGAYGSYVNTEHKTAASLQFTSPGTWYWAIQMEYGSYGAGFWYSTNTAGWLDMRTTPTPDLAVTVNPLSNPTSVTVVNTATNPAASADLGWGLDAQNHSVMIVRKTGTYALTPVSGQTYSLGNACDGGTVIYTGSGTACADTNLAETTTYYYSFFSVNHGYYSAGAFTNVTTTAAPNSPTIGRGPASLSFSAVRGSLPATQTLNVTNTGSGTLTYTNTLSWEAGSSNWLAITPAITSLTASAFAGHAVSVTASNLEPGLHAATNTLSGTQTNGTPIVAVTFTVSDLPAPTSVYASAVTPRSLTTHWTASGYDVMVVRRQGAAPEAPAQGTAYAHDATYGSGNQVVYAHGSGTSDADTGVFPQTIYYYGFYSENHSFYSPVASLCVTTAAAVVDGVADEWTGVIPPVVNSSSVSSNEFMWRDKDYEERTDPAGTDEVNADISEFRVRADSTNVYFYVRLQDITDVALPYIAVGIDTDQSASDTDMNWIGDQSGVSLGGGYAPGGMAAVHYSERNMIVHNVSGTGPVIELNAGGAWYAPPTLGQGANNVNAAGNFIEWAVARSDLGLGGSVTARFTVASFLNVTPGGWANDIDTTANYSGDDALDSLSVPGFGSSDAAGSMNAWDEELSDGDVDFFFDLRLDGNGVAANQIPDAPASLFPANATVIEQGPFSFSWGAASDPDGTVGSYFFELSTNALFNGGDNLPITQRLNTPAATRTVALESAASTQYYWRVRSRDLGGALSGATTASFQIGPADDDTQGPTPHLVYIGPSFTPGLTQTNITDGDLNNTNNLVDLAVMWTDPSGVFMTNHSPYGNANILASLGRVIPNWDLYTSNRVTGATQSFGYDEPFTDFYGHNGDTTVTTVFHNAFAVTAIETNNVFFLTLSAEDEDNDRGAYPDPQGDGDDVPWDRAITVNALVQFYLTDDDSTGPEFTAFNIDGASFVNSQLADGLTVTGLVQDAGSGVAASSNRYTLYRGAVQVASGSFTVQPATEGAARSTPEPVSVTFPVSLVAPTGTYRLVATGWDADSDKPNDRSQGSNEFFFTVSPPPMFNTRMLVTLDYDRAETLTNFPALVVLSPGLPGFSYSSFASSRGYDLRFSDASGETWYNYEIESWNTNGNSYVWVQVPRLSAASNTFWACWGSRHETNPPAFTTNGAAWAAEFKGVFHLQSTNGTVAADSTANARHGTLVNAAGSWSSGQIGNALSLSGAGGFVSNSLASGWTGPFTLSFWAKAAATGQAEGVGLFNSGSGGFQVETDGATPGAYRYAGGTQAAIGTVTSSWVFVTLTCDGVTTRTYFNGEAVGSASDARTTFARFDIGTGTNRDIGFAGSIDELEIAATPRSSNWVWAVWRNECSNGTTTAFSTPVRKGTFFQIDADASASGVGLPYTESFETLATGSLQGQSNWNASGVTVQGSVVYGGSRAARLTDGYAWHGLQPVAGTNVWIDWYAQPVRCEVPPQDVADLNWNATAAFYVDGSGHVVSRSNNIWVTSTGVAVPSNGWSRFTVHLDYTSHLWSLYVADNTPNAFASNAVLSLPFHATNVTALVSFRMNEDSPSSSSYLDNVGAGAVAPLAVDEDRNGLPDTWERAYFTSNGVPPDADSDHDGINNSMELLAGTHPLDSNSYLRILGMDLPSSASPNLAISLLGGGQTGGSPYTNTGDRTTRNFVIQRALNDVTAPKVTVATLSDTGTGTNTWTDAGAVATEGSRYYSIAVTFAGMGYTNTEEWAAHTQTRQAGGQYLITIPVDYGSAAANNLNSTLGQQLALGLHSGVSPDDADKIRRWDSNGSWQEYYLFTNGNGGVYWSADLGGATTANVPVAAGTAFWVVRGSSPAPRGNTVFTGRSFTSQSVADLSFKTTHGGWTMFGWTLPQPGRHRNQGAATPANQLGFSSVGTGGAQWDSVAYPNQVGDQIWVWENNTWSRWYWLVGNTGAAYDGRWWDNNYSGTGVWHFADFSLEVGKAYYYWHPANGGATNFTWHPVLP